QNGLFCPRGFKKKKKKKKKKSHFDHFKLPSSLEQEGFLFTICLQKNKKLLLEIYHMLILTY
ncbi:hypothetical protein KKC_15194, partial [Listeria fleischmannii subsp. coloradonensis]|uniref:hypothetical protein n=1 Tax=Listeria fleischmannii TaxID=1069827 RepID=UPI000254F423